MNLFAPNCSPLLVNLTYVSASLVKHVITRHWTTIKVHHPLHSVVIDIGLPLFAWESN